MTSWISETPAFSIASGSFMAFAIVTPSLITLRFSDSERTTFRPAQLNVEKITLVYKQEILNSMMNQKLNT